MADIQVGQSRSTGEWFVKLPGNAVQSVTEEQAKQIQADPGFLMNTLGAAGEATKAVLGGAASLLPFDSELGAAANRKAMQNLQAREMQSPVSTALGQALPYVAGETAGFAAGGPIGAAAVGGAMGAGGMPEAPLMGAAIGAVPWAAAPLIGAGARQAGRMAGIIDNGRMSGRVVGAMDAAGEVPEGRVLKGMLTTQEVEQTGAKLAPYQRMALDARTTEQFAGAERGRWASRMAGNDFPDEMASQRYAFTNSVKNELGIAGPENLTPAVVSRGLGEVGAEIGSFRTMKGPLTLADDQLKQFRTIADEANTTHQASFARLIKDTENSMAKNGGSLAPEDANSIMRRLSEMSAPGSDPTRIADAKKALGVFNTAIESKLNEVEKAAYKKAMYQYKILKTLDKSGAVGGDGTVNATSFGRYWDKKQAQALRGTDTLGKAADTFTALQMIREHPGSTMQRVIAQAPGKAVGAGKAAILPVLGLGALDRLTN